MRKNNYFLFVAIIFVSTLSFGADTDTPKISTTKKNDAQMVEIKKVKKEIKKNTSEIETIRKNKTLSGGLAIIESKLQKIISSPQFQEAIEKIATQEAQHIAQGKTLSQDSPNFPNLPNANKFLSWVYSLMANIAYYELLLSKLSSIDQQQQQTPTTATQEAVAGISTATGESVTSTQQPTSKQAQIS